MKRLQNDGFTLVEIIISITVATIMIGVLFSVTFRYFANAMQSQEAANLALESQTLLSQLGEDLRLSTGAATANALTDSHAPSGWQTSDQNNVLVIGTPVIDSSRNIVYNSETALPYANELIYFMSGNTMYKRTLRNTAATGNTAVATCPVASATSNCPADRVFSTNVSDISFQMFDAANATTTDPAQARSIKITVALSKNVFGKTVSLTNSTQVTQRNQ